MHEPISIQKSISCLVLLVKYLWIFISKRNSSIIMIDWMCSNTSDTQWHYLMKYFWSKQNYRNITLTNLYWISYIIFCLQSLCDILICVSRSEILVGWRGHFTTRNRRWSNNVNSNNNKIDFRRTSNIIQIQSWN